MSSFDNNNESFANYSFTALNSGILDLPPLADDKGKVTDTIFVNGPNGEVRWITLDATTSTSSRTAGKYFHIDAGDDDEDSEIDAALRAQNEEQERQEELRKFLLEKAKAQEEAEAQKAASSILDKVDLNPSLDFSSSSSSLNIDAAANNNNNNNKSKGSASTADQLWVTRYSATRFSDLLSDERVNLEVLQWLMAWKKKIQQNQINHQQKQSVHQKSKTSSAAAAAAAAIEEALPKIILLTGNPGVGKTTLAHVVCKHCGFDAIEVNASYSRSTQEMKQLIENATAERVTSTVSIPASAAAAATAPNSNGGESKRETLLRPKCLILDEIDGSTSNVIKTLLSIDVRRPVICLANNLYAPVLRDLRAKLEFVRQVPPLLPQRIASRLEAIAEQEKIAIDRHSLMDLALHCAGDIRQCLNTLFFVSRQVSGAASQAGAASRLLRMLRVREPTVSIWTLWEAAMERREKTKYVQNLSAAGVMSREDAAASKIDVGCLWLAHSASKCPELETVVNGLHEWFCQLGFPDYNCRATASVCESFAWLDRVNPFSNHNNSSAQSTGSLMNIQQGVTESAVINTFRNCATLSARPQQLRNAMPREAQNWNSETQRTKELIAEFIEKPSPHILGRIIKCWCAASAAAEDVLPQLAKLFSMVPFGLKLAPGVTQLSNLRNMKDADSLRRIIELLEGFGVSFQHESSSSSSAATNPKHQQHQQPQNKYGNNNNNNNYANRNNNNNNANKHEWRMVPDYEDWAKWKHLSKAVNIFNNNNNNPSQSQQQIIKPGQPIKNQMTDPSQGVVRAAMGVKNREPTVWEKNMKTSPSDIRELMVGEIALRKLQIHETQRRQRHEEETKKLSSASAMLNKNKTAATMTMTQDTNISSGGGPEAPPNSAAAAANKNQQAAVIIGVKKDFFGRAVTVTSSAAPKKAATANSSTTMITASPAKNINNCNDAAVGGDDSNLLSSSLTASGLKRKNQLKAQQEADQTSAALLPKVKYSYFDGSSNSVRKAACFSDFF